MNSIKAVFRKQAIDLFKNKAVLIQFVIFPIVAFVFTELVAKPDEMIPDNMFVTMFAAIFAGMTLITTMSAIIAEDRETKSLRFLVMAGVKPYEYLLGIIGVVMGATVIVAVLFGVMSQFTGADFAKFMIIMLAGSTASMLLGATLGMVSKNQQAATAIATPIAMILGFLPMLSMFNETIEKFTAFAYTQQISAVVNDVSIGLAKPLGIVLANIAVLTILFILAYRSKGLRD